MTVTDAADPITPARRRSRRPSMSHLRDYGIVIIVVVLFVSLAMGAENFLSTRNLFNILDQNAPLFLLALGTTFVILTGAFDLSSGQILSLAGVFAAQLTYQSGNPILGVLVAIGIGAPIGALNGYIVSRFRLNSFLVTLATGLMLGGLALWVTQGTLIDLSVNSTFVWLGSYRIGELPMSVIVMAVAFVAFSILLQFTRTGRYMYAVGSNQEAARLSGVSIVKLRTIAYALGGLAAAVAGVILVSRTGVGRVASNADTLTLDAIAAVVIGGTSISGGRGAMWRTLLGVLLLALLQNAFNLIGVQPYWQTIVTGLVILLAIVSNAAGGRSD